jgi:hypothetical protein
LGSQIVLLLPNATLILVSFWFRSLARQIPLVGCFRPVDGVQEGHVTCQFPTVAIVRRPVGLAVGRQLAAGTCFFLPYSGNKHSNWLIFFTGVETTNKELVLQISPTTSLEMMIGKGHLGITSHCCFLVRFPGKFWKSFEHLYIPVYYILLLFIYVCATYPNPPWLPVS